METPKANYRITNWKEYNQSLVNRGRLSLWLNETAIKSWGAPKKKKRGRPFIYSELAIEAALTVRYALNLTLRGVEGFLTSIFALLALTLPIPDYTLLCKRGKTAPQSKRPKRVTDIVLDSTGLKVYGEGEWKVKQHGKSKKGKWRKFHIGINPKTGKLEVEEATKSEVHDSEPGCRLIRSLKSVRNVYGDGAYDTKAFYDAVKEKGGTVIVPPRKGAVIDRNQPATDRNKSIQEILGLGGDELARKLWKILRGYHVRSLVETWISRFKRMLGGSLRSREERRQEVELKYKAKIMNRMTELGMPTSYAI